MRNGSRELDDGAWSIFRRNSVRVRSGASKNSLWTANWVPKRASAGAYPESSLGVVQKPRRTKGRCPARWAQREDFKDQWKCSIIPLDCRWKLVVVEWEIFNVSQTLAQKEDVNWAPRSEVKRTGMAKREIQVEIQARVENSCFCRIVGTRGRTEPVETSQRTVESL